VIAAASINRVERPVAGPASTPRPGETSLASDEAKSQSNAMQGHRAR
jgi:hypothetical protein